MRFNSIDVILDWKWYNCLLDYKEIIVCIYLSITSKIIYQRFFDFYDFYKD